MPTRLFTARWIDALKPTRGKRTEYVDKKVPGLVLRITRHGVRTWTLRYRHRGRSLRLTLAPVDELSLADARERARDELQAVRKGGNPAVEKQDGRKAETIGDLAELYIAKWAKPRKRSWKADDNLLRKKVLPKWRRRAIVDITRADVRLLVEAVAEKGAPIVANRVAALLSKLFAFALDRDLVTTSPAVRIPRPGQEKQRDRVLTEDEIRTLWSEFDALDTSMAAYYKLRLLTLARGGEVAAMRWSEVDVAGGWWTIPSRGSKNKLAHRVPLTPSVLALLQPLRPNETPDEDSRAAFVLAGARGKRQQAEAAALFTVPDFVGHDLRRTGASMMASHGIPRLTISKILNHAETSVTAVYDRHSYDPEKASALSWWDAHLLTILATTTKRAAVVVPMR